MSLRSLHSTLARLGLRVDVAASATLFASRNPTLIARSRRGERFFVKSSVPGDPGVAREGRVLQHLPLGLPLAHVRHASSRVLVVEHLRGTTLHAIRRARGHGHQLDRPLGALLARLQLEGAQCAPLMTEDVAAPLAQSLLRTTPQAYAALGPAGRSVFAAVQANARALQTLHWLVETEPTGELALVHGDFRQANVLVARATLRVVDWEGAGRGDPTRDVGMLLADDFRVWVAPENAQEQSTLSRRNRHLRGVLAGWEAERARRGVAAAPLERARIVGWMAEALLRHAHSAAHHHFEFQAHLVDAAVALLDDPVSWARELLGAA